MTDRTTEPDPEAVSVPPPVVPALKTFEAQFGSTASGVGVIGVLVLLFTQYRFDGLPVATQVAAVAGLCLFATVTGFGAIRARNRDVTNARDAAAKTTAAESAAKLEAANARAAAERNARVASENARVAEKERAARVEAERQRDEFQARAAAAERQIQAALDRAAKSEGNDQ